METITGQSLLNYPPDTLYQIRKMFNLEKPGRMKEAIDILEAWIKQQEHFESKSFDRNYLEILIIACKGSLEKAKQKIDKLCTLRTLAPEYFGCELTLERDGRKLCIYGVMPRLTSNYHIIVVAKMLPAELNPDDHLLLVKDWIISNEYLTRTAYNLGVILVVDYRECNMKDMLMAFNMSVVRKYITIMQEGFGVRSKGLHYLSNSKLLNNFLAYLKPLLPEKISNRVYAHNDLESLHKEVPRELLCEDLGGDEPPLSVLHDNRVKYVGSKEHIEYMKESLKQRTDESKRIGEKIDVDFLPGTFRSLNVD